MSTYTSGKMACPLCGAPGCSPGRDSQGAFLLCPNPACGPNATGGKIADWYVVTGSDEERKSLHALFPVERP
jgi:hypothetical protein